MNIMTPAVRNSILLVALWVFALGVAAPCSSAEERTSWKAGRAKTRITPEKSLWMGGFGARTKTSSGTLQELYAKALALDDGSGRPAVLVTADILDGGGHLPTAYPYPLQVWQFGPDLTLIALAGEPVVDYALRLKRELGADKLWVAGYNNDVFAYIPSRRVLEEGGYEGGGATVGARLPGPFAPTVEETIVRKVHELVERTRVQ